ncbi:hypothetical protein GALMADRAFT_136125 [Galerina marginata CBS 339.88]|uniref:Uncharacterized protein n=1 Tax=Galerina marginata (strain CBS 339.88) TaxID=685588 RepID=A0A067TFE7_GALM3|nr:hypothetical protein GALMADRAFT_136125 [Galerina marginata CBS 339.88]
MRRHVILMDLEDLRALQHQRLTVRPGIITLPDSTPWIFCFSQILGQLAKYDQKNDFGRVVVVHLDFAKARAKKCGDDHLN